MARRKGHIANIGSMFGMIAFPYFTSYSASKFALRGLSDALRRELEEYSITVSYIAPRATRTPAQSQFDHLIVPFNMKLDVPNWWPAKHGAASPNGAALFTQAWLNGFLKVVPLKGS